MGRGKKRFGGAHANAVSATSDSQSFEEGQIALADLLAHGEDIRSAGQVLSLDGGDLVLDLDTPALIARGLTGISALKQRPDGLYFVRFADGETALLDLDGLRVAISNGTSINDPRLYGALACAKASQSFAEGDLDGEALNGLYRDFRDDPADPAIVQALAQQAGAALHTIDGDLTLNDCTLQDKLGLNAAATPSKRSARISRRGPMVSFAAARSEVTGAFSEAKEDSANMKQLKGMVFGWDDDTDAPLELHPKLQEMGAAASAALDRPVVDDGFIDDLYLNDTLTQSLGTLFERYTVGQRTFAAMGHQGTGKDTLFRTVAAVLGRPLVNLSGGKGVQVQEWIGGEALKPYEVYDNCHECAKCKDGKPDECAKKKLVAAFNISAVQYGMLTTALQQPCVVHISEIRGMEDQMYALADVLGSGVGDEATNRFLTINSPSGTETIQVDPHCILALSWNPDVDDWRPYDATMRRIGIFCFDPLGVDEEARRIESMTLNILKQQPSFTELHDLKSLKVDVAGEEVDYAKPIAEFQKRFANAVEAQSDEISSSASPQLFSYFLSDIILKAANQATTTDDAAAPEQAIQWSLTMLEGYMNQNLPHEERKKKLTKLLGDAQGPLGDLVAHVRKLVSEE